MNLILFILLIIFLPVIAGLALVLDCALNDSRRLDWMERSRSEIDTDGPGFIIYGGDKQLGEGLSAGSFKRLRAAIDAAMRNARKGSSVPSA